MYKTNPWLIVSTVLITGIIVGGVFMLFNKIQDKKITVDDPAITVDDPIVKDDKDVVEEMAEEPEEVVEVIEEDVSIEDIRAAFTVKYPDHDYADAVITIEKSYDNKFAEGMIGAPEGGGAHYWAALTDDVWTIIHEAQDTPPCSVFEPYDFPVTTCY